MSIEKRSEILRTINNGIFSLTFASDGRPASICLIGSQRELLDIKCPGYGFKVTYQDGGVIPMTNVFVDDGDRLVAATENRTQEVVFKMHINKTYIGFHLERIKGFPTNSNLCLEFEINVDNSIKVIEHNYMTIADNMQDGVKVKWPGLWQRTKGDPLGGFSLYHKFNEDDEDDTIIRIWTQEGLAHPQTDGEWTYERAKEWINEWQRKFPDRSLYDVFSVMGVEADNLEELYKCAEYAKIAGVSGIYLMPWIWRGEYWPVKQTTDGINTKIFPKGEEDLKAYSDYLASMGLHLELHNVSGGIGFQNPKYVKPKVDPRLASWGTGKLAEDITADSKTIKFIPDKGTEIPYRIPRSQYFLVKNEMRCPTLAGFHDYNIICVNNELIRVGSFIDTDRDVWILDKCERGFGNLAAEESVQVIEATNLTADSNLSSVVHMKNSMVKGLITTYNVNLLPDNWSTLLNEIAESFAGLLNRCNIAHASYDGFEIHRFFGFGQDEKFASLVYSATDHPVVADTSGGLPPKCYIEYRLNSTRRLLGNGKGVTADLRKHRLSWNASSLLEAHYALNIAAANGTRAVGIRDHHNGVNLDILNGHGRSKEILETVNNWKKIIPVIPEDIREKMGYSEPEEAKLIQSGSYPRSKEVYVLRKMDELWKLYPTRVLSRKSGDIKWYLGQEHGIIAPKQYVKPGDPLELENPFSAQELKFVIKVLYAHDYVNSNNIDIIPNFDCIQAIGDYRIKENGSETFICYDNFRNEEIWNENNLPYWECDIDMSNHRALGMWIDGDLNESVLALQIPGRDYVVPIDFEGYRYIEIPNGEAAWANGNWGWRMGTWKYIDYSKVNKISLGFGKMPQQSECKVKMKGIKALSEIESKIVDPVIKVGNGELRIKGKLLSGQYLEYIGGESVTVYDENWNIIEQLPVEKIDYVMPNGWETITIKTIDKKLQPWLEVQFITEGKEIKIN